MTPVDPSPELDAMARRHALRWIAFLAVTDVLVWCAIAYFSRENAPVIAVGLLAFSAVSLAAVTVLYALERTGWNPGDVLKGLRYTWLQPLFLPYRFVAYLVTAIARILHLRDPVISEIGPGVFMGVRLFPHEGDTLLSRNIRSIVDLTSELPTNRVLDRAPFTRLGVAVLDRCPPTHDQIARIADWVATQREKGESVFIHCAFGRGRSATVTAAVVLRLGWARDADEAIAFVTRRRPVIRVRGAQYTRLREYAARLAAR